MRLDELRLSNFRGFERKQFSFSEHVNVIIGDNGTGKTAILDAIAVAAGGLLLGFDGVAKRHIEQDEVRRVPYEKAGVLTIEPQYPAQVTCRGVVLPADKPIGWSRSLDREGGRTTRRGTTSITKKARSLKRAARSGKDVCLPLVAYYGTGRLWLQKRQKSVEVMKPGSRLLGYVDCLDPASNQKLLLEWLKRMELIEFQERAPQSMLRGVYATVAECLVGWDEVRFEARFDDIIARSWDGHALPFRMLSDGVRNMLGMVADIAYRAAVLNPHFGPQAATKTPGIVLIDEVDLHLHPKWQRRVIDDLRRTFPLIQFFATTHSPFIIQSLRPGELIDLNDDGSNEYYKRSIEDIAEGVMGVDLPQRSKRWQDMMKTAEEYYRMLQGAKSVRKAVDIARLKHELDRLLEPFSDDPAYVAFLRMEREAAGLGEGGV